MTLKLQPLKPEHAQACQDAGERYCEWFKQTYPHYSHLVLPAALETVVIGVAAVHLAELGADASGYLRRLADQLDELSRLGVVFRREDFVKSKRR